MSDDDIYQPENIFLFEALYGAHLISLGGHAAIDNMFSDLTIRGLKALDLGFGLGGVAFYLAEKYQMNVSGIEIYSWMVQYAKEHTPKNLLNAVEFSTYDNQNKLPFKPETFDLVYSKGVLNHIADKTSLFQQVNKVLKNKGLFVIADWVFPKKIISSDAPLVCETKTSYEKFLIETGFSKIHYRDDSELFLGYTKKLLENLTSQQKMIKNKYGEELFLIIEKQHEELMNKIKQHEKFAVRIVARKY